MRESGERKRKSSSMYRCACSSAFVLFCALTAAPAGAQYMRSGLLKWTYDDFSVKTTEGTRKSSGFSQSYGYSVDGPLGSQMVGEGGGSLNFTQGKSLSQTVNSSDANQKILAYSFHGSLLPPGLRRYVTLAPSFSRTRTEQVWGSPPASRNLVDTNNALTWGLSLPRLPSFSVSSSHMRRRDPSAVSSVSQDTYIRSEASAYVRGPLRLQYRRERSETEDKLSAASNTRKESTRSDAELNFPELKGTLERASLRASYQGEGSESAAGSMRQNSKTVSAYTATRRFRTRRWESFLGYAGEYSRSSQRRVDSAQNSLTLTSFSPLLRGRIDNQLAYLSRSGFEKRQSVSESATGEWRSLSGKAALRASADGSWAYEPLGGAVLSSGFRNRLTLTPRRIYDVYGEAATAGTRSLGRGPGGSRQYSAGGGLGLHPMPATDLTGNYMVTRTRNFADGSVSLNRSLTAQAQSSPLETLKLAATYSLTWSRDEANGISRGRMMGLTADYSPAEGFDFYGELTRGVRAANLILNGSYSVGKTQLSVRFQKQDSYSTNGFANWNLSLSRFL